MAGSFPFSVVRSSLYWFDQSDLWVFAIHSYAVIDHIVSWSDLMGISRSL